MKTLEAGVDRPQTDRAYTGFHYFLPKGIIDVEGKLPESGGSYQLSVARHNEPDRSRRYRLVQCNSPLHEDTTDLHVSDKGLLTDALNLTSESKTPDILFNLTDTAINIATIQAKLSGVSPMTAAAMTAAGLTATPEPVKPFKVSFDPLLQRERLRAIAAASAAGFIMTIEVPYSDAAKGVVVVEQHPSAGGVFYRPLTTVKLRITPRDLGQSPINLNTNVPIPDTSSIAVFDLHRAALVKKPRNSPLWTANPARCITTNRVNYSRRRSSR